jgi:hypothetical protein
MSPIHFHETTCPRVYFGGQFDDRRQPGCDPVNER